LYTARPIASVKQTAELIKGARFAVRQTGHLMAAQSPELLTPLILDFLQEFVAGSNPIAANYLLSKSAGPYFPTLSSGTVHFADHLNLSTAEPIPRRRRSRAVRVEAYGRFRARGLLV
jgi:hypothetical protein